MNGIRWGKKLGKEEETGTEPWKYYARLTDGGLRRGPSGKRTCESEKQIPRPPKPRDSGWHKQNVGTDLKRGAQIGGSRVRVQYS
jgi:hypothetical protein